MSISNEGITLYRINKLVWSDISTAYKTKSLGFNSIYIKRNKGIPWSIPLYLEGNTSIKDALLEKVPQDNILYIVANEL